MISVVVPIYNVSQYLSQCIDSILTQSYQDDGGVSNHLLFWC